LHWRRLHIDTKSKTMYFNDSYCMYEHPYHQAIMRYISTKFPDCAIVKLPQPQQIEGEKCCVMVCAMNTHAFSKGAPFLSREGIVAAFPKYQEIANATASTITHPAAFLPVISIPTDGPLKGIER
jgi:hypothetical protein